MGIAGSRRRMASGRATVILETEGAAVLRAMPK